MNIKVGDCVKVKKRTRDPDFEDYLIEDWTGKVVEILEEYDNEDIALISIKWDNGTLLKMSKKYIKECEKKELDWKIMNLYVSDIELLSSKNEEESINQKLQRIFGVSNIATPNRYENKLKTIFQGINSKNEWECFQAWEKHLSDNLTFPFEAKLTPSGYNWKNKDDKKFIARNISSVEDKYGVIVSGTINRNKIGFPLCDLELLDSKSPNFEIVKDYVVWFANR